MNVPIPKRHALTYGFQFHKFAQCKQTLKICQLEKMCLDFSPPIATNFEDRQKQPMQSSVRKNKA